MGSWVLLEHLLRPIKQLSHSLPEMVRGFIIPMFVNDYATHWF